MAILLKDCHLYETSDTRLASCPRSIEELGILRCRVRV